MISLIFRFLQLINNVFIRLTGLCSLAESSINYLNSIRARVILEISAVNAKKSRLIIRKS